MISKDRDVEFHRKGWGYEKWMANSELYCGKLLVVETGLRCSIHYHKLKDETFQVLHGELHVTVEGKHRILIPGETCHVQPGVWHSFWSETGVVFEEISTQDVSDDSFYRDKAINKLDRSQRKTVVDHWGRFQLPEIVGDGAD